MEEIYQLLNERLNGIRDLIQKFDSLQSQIDFDSTYSLTSQQINDLSTYIMNLRKNEKMRVLRENDYVEIILAYQNFEPSLRMYRFFALIWLLTLLLKPFSSEIIWDYAKTVPGFRIQKVLSKRRDQRYLKSLSEIFRIFTASEENRGAQEDLLKLAAYERMILAFVFVFLIFRLASSSRDFS